MSNKKTTILIPVYNSEKIVSNTVSQIIASLETAHIPFEIILVNDGSKDDSWKVIKNLANENDKIKAINLLKNYGQHSAQYCGLKYATGDYIVTMDDDLQNPPAEIITLFNKIEEGYDLVIAKFRSKKHASYRKIGTRIINYMNKKIFNKPKDIELTNFRIFKKIVSDRLLNHKTNYPYIPGLLLLNSYSIANVMTDHHPRSVGTSNYSLMKILKLVSRLLINYSSYPLKMLTGVGLVLALLSFSYGFFTLIKAIFQGASVPGWASLIVLMSFLNGISIIMTGILGIYISRTLNQISNPNPYIIHEIVE